jgi:hypothetical protein
MAEWNPIETAPKGQRVIAYFSDGDILLCHVSDWRRDEGDDYWPTHWMPLPEPPSHSAGE